MSEEEAAIDQVFCYGTLLPGQERWRFLAPFVLAQEPDRVTGRLYDTGLGYPAAFFDRVGVIHGVRFRLDPDRLEEAFSLLDEIEGAVDGMYHRVTVATGMGEQVYAYQYGGEGSGLMDLPEGNWLSR
ncbi:MAG TPA: hypothetical protein DCX77_07970 [Acidimicrobiaceae bacterium]|nr:hypothetical protein [Acidimicrobiaceae bacterium]HAX05598.1 hypothetical protein [Acidimicrobiaceae bacterium]|tara:strand:+ start:192 stop:575 length:384 start_codon:yes stop_codon:yes gene_type:complete